MTRAFASALASSCLLLSLLPAQVQAQPPAGQASPPAEQTSQPSQAPLTLESITLIPPPAPEGAEPEPEAPPPQAETPPAPPVVLPLEPTLGDRPYTGKKQILAGWTLVGLGAVLLTTSFLTTTCNYEGALECKYAEHRTVWVPTSATVLMAGGISLASGYIAQRRHRAWQRDVVKAKQKAQASLVPVLSPAQSGVALVGSF